MDNNSSGGIIFIVLFFVIIIALLYGISRIFEKAGKPGWTCIVPFYSNYVLGEIIYGEGNGWKGFLVLIPTVGQLIGLLMLYRLGECFGKDVIYSILLAILSPIFMPLLGLSGDTYKGPVKSFL